MSPLPRKGNRIFYAPPFGVGANGAGPGRGSAAPSASVVGIYSVAIRVKKIVGNIQISLSRISSPIILSDYG